MGYGGRLFIVSARTTGVYGCRLLFIVSARTSKNASSSSSGTHV
jgi:hypothetical protein